MTNDSSRINLVEQLRGIAALSVTWFHLTNGYKHWVEATGSLGWLGVEIFFVISGMIIPLSLHKDWRDHGLRSVPLFFARRLIRIEPPYLLSIAFVIILNHLVIVSSLSQVQRVSYPPEQILLHLAYLIPFSSYSWIQVVYWTLAYEFAFYLIVPLLMSSLISARQVPTNAILAALIALIAFEAVSPLLGLFAMGCCIFRSRIGLVKLKLSLIQLLALAAGMAMTGEVTQPLIGILTSILLLFEPQLSHISARLTLLAKLGTISFSLYLLHVPVGGKIVNLGQRWLTSPWSHFFLSLFALVCSIIAAYLFWRVVEQPCVSAARSLSNRLRPSRIARYES